MLGSRKRQLDSMDSSSLARAVMLRQKAWSPLNVHFCCFDADGSGRMSSCWQLFSTASAADTADTKGCRAMTA